MRFVNQLTLLWRVLSHISNWHVYLLDFFGFYPRGKRLIYTFRSGTLYTVRSGMADRWILNEVVLRNAYFPREFTIKDDSTVIDIGAHIGTFSVLAAEKCRHGKVFACEPNPENFSILSENIRINNLKNAKAINKAVGGKTEQRSFFVNTEDSDRHTLIKDFAVNEKNFITASVTSLDDLLRDENIASIDLLKIDCEGCEYELFNEKNSGFLNCTKQIIIEIHDLGDPQKKKSLISFIEKNGFCAFGKEEGVTHFVKNT